MRPPNNRSDQSGERGENMFAEPVKGTFAGSHCDY